MIKTQQLNKYYNKNKNNEIHVLNNVSLDFPNKGLVCLLGASGSGKTTLLNVIGGLDSVANGTIDIANQNISKYNANQWDVIRNEKIGYIFQDYKLIKDETVFENVCFALKTFKLSQDEIKEKVMDALDIVSMSKFHKRNVTQLSGGQQQRIAIARAIVKCPEVIIADEPTGNLDEVNTNNIMAIIKAIAKNRLVVLVTHEERIANFYGDRIIKLVDGKIVSDVENNSETVFENNDDRNIYLGEYKKEEISNESIKVNYYHQQEKNKVEINLVNKNGAVYLSIGNSEVPINILTDENEIKLKEGDKPKFTNSDLKEELVFSLDDFDKTVQRRAHVTLKNEILGGFRKVFKSKRRQKFMLSGLAISAFITCIALGTLLKTIIINPEEFASTNQNIYYSNEIYDDEKSDIDITDLAKNNDVLIMDDSLKISDSSFNLYNKYSRYDNLMFNSSTISPFTVLNKDEKMVAGRAPENRFEVLVDLALANKIVELNKSSGLNEVEDLLFSTITYSNSNLENYNDADIYELSVSGIINRNNLTYYVHPQTIYSLSSTYDSLETVSIDYTDGFTTDYDLTTLGFNDVLVSNKDTVVGSTIEIDHLDFIVKGYFEESVDEEVEYMVNKSAFNVLNCKYDGYSLFYSRIYAYDKESFDDYIKTNDLPIVNAFEEELEHYKEVNLQITINLQIVSAVFFFIAGIYLYFVIRSSLFLRIREVGIYRCLGVSKTDIYKLFAGEIIAITLTTSLIGFLIANGIMYSLRDLTFFFMPIYVAIPLFIAIGLINLIIGLLPVFMLLRKTPAEIMSKYDI